MLGYALAAAVNVGYVAHAPYFFDDTEGVGGVLLAKLATRLGWSLDLTRFSSVSEAEACLDSGSCDYILPVTHQSALTLSYPLFYVRIT